jgi:hypothetical protein
MTGKDTNKSEYKKKIAAAFASLAFVIISVLVIFTGESLNIYSITSALTKSIPASFALGVLGYFMGSIFDNKKKKSTKRFASSLDEKSNTTSTKKIESDEW